MAARPGRDLKLRPTLVAVVLWTALALLPTMLLVVFACISLAVACLWRRHRRFASPRGSSRGVTELVVRSAPASERRAA